MTRHAAYVQMMIQIGHIEGKSKQKNLVKYYENLYYRTNAISDIALQTNDNNT